MLPGFSMMISNPVECKSDKHTSYPAVCQGSSGMQVTLVYQAALNAVVASSPFLSTLSKQFAVDVIVRQAMVTASGGTMELALVGEQDEINRAVASLQTSGATLTGPIVIQDHVTKPVLSNVPRGT